MFNVKNNLMNQLNIESIRVTRCAAKGGFKNEINEEVSYLFLEQFFDDRFNKIKEVILSEEGDEEQIILYSYNNDNKLIAEQHQFIFDEIEEKTNFIYHDGLLVEKRKEFSYGSIETTIYSYNQDKLPTLIKVVDDHGEEEESEVFEYEGKNLIHYVKQNALIGKDTELWLKYDEKNRLIEEKKWTHNDLKTFTSHYNYTKNEQEPDVKIMNEKGAVVEAHIKQCNDKNQVVMHEIQYVNNGLKTLITSYEYNEFDKVVALEAINQNKVTERSLIASYDEKGLLTSELKSEYEVAIGSINTFTLNYEYTFH